MEHDSMAPDTPEDAVEVFAALVRYETRLWAALERRLADERLPGLGRIWAARSIRRHEGSGRVHELSRDLGTTAGAASKLVDRLVLDGLVVRRPHPVDRRSSVLALSPAGNAALDAGLAAIRAALDETFADDGPTVDGLHRALLALDHRLTERTSG